MIVQELHSIQHIHGFLPEKELRALAARTGTRLHRLHEVASFFPHFKLEEPKKIQVRICQDMSCQIRGAGELLASLNNSNGTIEAGSCDVQEVSCLGRCDRAPAAFVASRINAAGSNGDEAVEQEHVNYYMNLDEDKLNEITRLTGLAVKNNDASALPETETDVDWGFEQKQDWTIDVYDGKPDEECYLTIQQFAERSDSTSTETSWLAGDEDKESVEIALSPRGAPIERRVSIRQYSEETQRILCSLFQANLLGMGGAGGRAYKKWFEVLQAEGDVKYVVCNADESEPGTFKDREILLRAPHLVVEAVMLAGLLLGAKAGYIYIRHEFEEQIRSVREEIRRAERLGACGDNIYGSDLSFSVDVFVSPGGYICGEQTALIEAMEDKRAEPRNRPPELQTNGLWDCPTLLNNVETFAWVPAILLKDNGKWFAGEGSKRNESYKGRRFFSISGDVAKPGAYEVPIGITLGELINDYAGGMANGLEFKAAALSGPSGGFTPRFIPVGYLNEKWVEANLPDDAVEVDLFQLELDIQVCRDIGIMMGAGMVVFSSQTDMVATALSATTFYRNESCGKCVPCRIGSQKLVEILTDISNAKLTMSEIYGDSKDPGLKDSIVDELAETMKLTAICGLGTVASNPLTTLLNYFRSDVEKTASQSS